MVWHSELASTGGGGGADDELLKAQAPNIFQARLGEEGLGCRGSNFGCLTWGHGHS